jgi:hypothetical protein
MAKKTADLSSTLVAVKGSASVSPDTSGRQIETPKANKPKPSTPPSPLNFKVDAEFRRRFRQRAAEYDLKLNQLLYEALEAWEEKRGIKSGKQPIT